MMNKSLLAHSAKSSRNSIYGFQQVRLLKRRCAKSTPQKKSRRFRRLLKLITGRRQTEWTGATRCPNKDDPSHKRESLINRKQAISFRLCLPCRPLAECGCSWRDGGRIPLHESSRQALLRARIHNRWASSVGDRCQTLSPPEKTVGGSFRHAAPRAQRFARFNSATGACEKTFLTIV